MKQLLTLSFLFWSILLFGQDYQLEKISTYLLEKIESRSSDVHSIIVQASSQVDIQALLDSFNLYNIPADQRAIHTNNVLRKTADTSRGELEAIVHSLELEDVQYFWIVNGFSAKASGLKTLELSTFNQISYIDIERKVDWEEPTEMVMSAPLKNGSNGNLERDIKIINAPAMWERGYTGRGRKALIIDTGVDPLHPALRRNYAGNIIPENQAWFSSNPFPRAADCGSHGTHVAGTILGIDRLSRDTIGVAYNALWMGTPGLCGFETGGVITHLQWALDPDGDPNTTDDIPDVINNSWGYLEFENECNGLYISLLTALEAAGIAVVFSAGNEGPNSQTLRAPANINISLVNSFTVGNIDGRNLNINDGSSRGPSICGGEGSLLIKPEVSAPGTLVRSSIPGGYALFTGTSMAAPHVSGALLLLKEAFPYLSGEALKLALYFSAKDLGVPGEDNAFGMGLIDVDAAFEYLVSQGHVPIDPKVDFDIAIEEYSYTIDHCTGEISPMFIITNAGKQTIHGFEISVELENENPISQTIFSSSQQLAPGEKLEQFASFFLEETPSNRMSFRVALIGHEDQFPFDNQITFDVPYSPVSPIDLSLNETIFEKFICGGTHFVLQNEDPTTNFLWYYNEGDTQPFLKSNERVIQAPEINGDIDFHVGLEIEETILLANKSKSAIEVQPDERTGVRFSTNHDLFFHHFMINPTARSFHTLQIIDDNGVVVWEANRFYSAGEHIVQVNRLLQGGKVYFLSTNTNRPVLAYELKESDSFRIDEYVEIREMVINNSPTVEFLPAVHGLHLTAEVPCKKKTFSIKVKTMDSTPIANFSIINDEVININEPVLFQNESIHADRVLWSFGDGELSTEFTPSKKFSEPGIYEVELKAWGGPVCHDLQRKSIKVEESTSVTSLLSQVDVGILVYPNPSSTELYIESERGSENPILKCEIIHTNGQVLDIQFDQTGDGILKINTRSFGLPSGIYCIRAIMKDNSIHVKQFVIL